MILVIPLEAMGKKCVNVLMCSLLAAFAVALPAASQPTASRLDGEYVAYLGRPSEVYIEVRWHAAADAYFVLPPEFDGVDWAEIVPGPTEASVQDGDNVVRQTVVVTPHEVGSFEVPDFRVGYLSPGDLDATRQPEEVSEEQEPEREIPRLLVSGFTMEVRKDRTVLWIALAVVGAGALLYLGGMGVFLLRRAQENRPATEAVAAQSESDSRPADFRGAGLALHEAKRNRVDGDVYAFYSSLAKSAEMLGSEHGELAGVLQARAQKVGFQGYAPTEDEMETDYRAVARVLKQTRDEDEAPAS